MVKFFFSVIVFKYSCCLLFVVPQLEGFVCCSSGNCNYGEIAMKEEQENTPLRIILQNFINHVEKLETYQSENSYEKDFQDLKLFSENLRTVGEYSCKEGEKEINRKKNRYKDILPFDYTRVTLSEYATVPGSDYINANYIKGASGSPAYIASQGPLPHTVNDFWRMVVECEVQVIVMACNEEESGKHKCENYWVEKEGEEKEFGMATIRLLKASTICPDFLVRTMHLKYMNCHSKIEERVVCQFHYGAWPDHGVPGLVRPLLEMVRLVRDTQASETLPVLVHCSAGCGRTGTICAIDYVWGLLRAGKLKLDFSLFKLVRDMRRQRIAMVQTKDQYILVHQAVKELFQDQLRMIHSHPYENIDIRGHPLVPALSPKMGVLNPEIAAPTKEKQDHREKENSLIFGEDFLEEDFITSYIAPDAPPVPQKRRIHIVSSKQEKEVENLTQKQLSLASAFGKTRLSSSLLKAGDVRETNDKEFVEKSVNKECDETRTSSSTYQSMGITHNFLPPPAGSQAECVINEQNQCIAKLKALFEANVSIKETTPRDSRDVKLRFPQLVTRSHSLGAVRKPKKFTQFSRGPVETEMSIVGSGTLNENDKLKSVSSVHVEISSSGAKEVSTITCALKNVPQMNSVHMSGNINGHENSLCEPLTSLPSVVKKSFPSSTISGAPSHVAEKLYVTQLFSDIPRPALPIKRSKSLKSKMIGESFKLSLAKRSYGLSQELATTKNCSIPPCSLNNCSATLISVSQAAKAHDILHPSEKVTDSQFYEGNISGKLQFIPRAARVELSETDCFANKRLDINESHAGRCGCSSEVPQDFKFGLLSSKSRRKFSAESKCPTECSGMKKNLDSSVKAKCDVCQTQSLKREKSSLSSTTLSQESEFVNTEISNPSNIIKVKPSKEPLKFRTPNNNISESRTQVQQHNSLPMHSCTMFEHCSNDLMSEGVVLVKVSESQKIAHARHKVDTVIGGLGIRERRNSFRCAVGQSIDENMGNTIAKNKIGRDFESHLLVQGNKAKSSTSVKRQVNTELTQNSNLRNQVKETSAIFKSPADFQKFNLANYCEYLPGVQKSIETREEVNSVPNKLVSMTDVSHISSDLSPQYMRPKKKTCDSSYFPTSTLKQHSVGASEGRVDYPPGMHESNFNTTKVMLLNSTKSSTYKPAGCVPPPQQLNSIPKKKEIDSAHSSENLMTLQNTNLVVPLEVDVDQVGARMRDNLQEKSQGAKCLGASENNSQGSNGTHLTHFTRALEVFHQTAASIRTKFSKSTGSGANSLKTETYSKMNPVIQSYSASLNIQHGGNHKRGEDNVSNICEQQRVLKKQQQYL